MALSAGWEGNRVHYPLTIDLRDKKCVVVGGGAVAQRKVETLVDFEAQVTVIAPDITFGLNNMVREELIGHLPRDYRNGDLQAALLVIAATDDRDVNSAIYAEACDAGVLVNVVDCPDQCTFFVPAVIRRGDLVVSVSTGGKSPALAKHLREDLERFVGPEYGEYLRLMSELRARVYSLDSEKARAGDIFKRFLNSDILDLLRDGKSDIAARRMESCMS